MDSKQKILTLSALKKIVAQLKRQKKTIAFTNGCFDLMHLGHVSYLEAAKKNDRVLIVGLNSDSSIRKIKDPSRPIVSQISRSRVLAALACVDYVTIFNEATPYHLVKALGPDVLIKGADWKGKEIVGADIVKASGGRVEFIKYIDHYSTTNIIESILHKCAKK